MSEFTTVARVDEIPEGEARSFQVAGRIIGKGGEMLRACRES